ncbi:hypothetical protein C0J52_08239 [Blattella germanica]|nr:hypothetical protein C0J52_08239 [Blattella germanica]
MISGVSSYTMSYSKIKIEDTGLEVLSSWEVANNKIINDTVTFSTDLRRPEKDDLEHIVSLDTCIHLRKPEVDNVQLKLNLAVTKSLQIKKISVVSEARVVELYGKCEEYVTTVHADFFDECEDMSVYTAEAELPHPTSECCLKGPPSFLLSVKKYDRGNDFTSGEKFARLQKRDEMWLYGIHLTIEKVDPCILPHSSVNFHNVNRILKDSGHQLTEKAEKCKKFLQLYSKSQMKSPDPQILMKMFEAEYLAQQNPISSKAKIMSKCLTEIIPGFVISPKDKVGTEFEATATDKEMENPSKLDNIAEILKHVDLRFSELERKMLQQVDEKLKELERKQNEKLDLILNRLEDLKNVMNVRGPEG